MRIRIKGAAVLGCCLLLLGGCVLEPRPGSYGLPERPGETGGQPPKGHIAYQPPFLPISFSINTAGEFEITVNARLVTPLGVLTAVAGGVIKDIHGRALPREPADVTQLIICKAGTGRQRCQGYQIASGRKMRIEMNGQFIQEIERNRIVIDAAPGAQVRVVDIGPSAKREDYGPARIDVEEFEFHEVSLETDVDLERSRSGTISDLTYNHVTGRLKSINGAKLAVFDTYGWGKPDEANDYPSEYECMQVDKEDWKVEFSEDELDSKYIISCIKTAEGDLGYLFIDPDNGRKPVAYYVYSRIWVR